MKEKFVILFSGLLMFANVIFAQSKITVTGTVLEDGTSEPVIGANILIKGTTNGTVSDLNGKYILHNVPSNGTLIISFIGMKSAQLLVNNQRVINVALQTNVHQLNDVVVIGYGTSKAKDLTSPISVVKGEEISNVATSSPMSALQGKVPGLSIVNSNAPGAGPSVTIRGIGSFNGASPLYVVDGMFYDNITFLNNSDIQEISVLKDASAAAIYGVRAANGVVIVTTKKGFKSQKPKVTYEGYVGVQKASNVLKMANSQQYATMMMEADYNTYSAYMKNSIDLFGGSHSDSDFHNWTYGANTDWYKELLRTAEITNHSLNISGGSDKASYAIGVNYLYQNGIMDSKNNYKRLNFHANLDYDAYSWLKVGTSFVTSSSKQYSPNNSAWQQAFNMPSIIPVYSDKNTSAAPKKYASPSQVGFTSNFYNPIATANYYDNLNEIFQVLPTFYAEVSFIPNKLKFRTQFSQDFSLTNNRTFIPSYYVSSWQQSSQSSLTKSDTKYYNYILDNTLTYQDSFGQHNVTAMIGQSSREDNYRLLSGTATNVPDLRDEYLYLVNGNTTGRTVNDDGTTFRGLSYFGRVQYNYADKYLLTATMRADGSSKYNNKWGYFPSVGIGWVMSNENFMKDIKGINYLKLRASWGKLGNDNIAPSDGYAGLLQGKNTYNGVFGNTTVPGYYYDGAFSWLSWEVVEEYNVGVNFMTLNNRLTVDLDYFNRTTNNAVISTILPLSNSTLAGNNGKINNQGFELSLNWNDKIGKDLTYNVALNMSTLRNRVTSLNGAPYIYGGSAECRTIDIVGQPVNSYYGYKVAGIYQTASEIANDPVAQKIIASGINLEPGDFKYKDVNGDKKLDDKDRVTLGSNIPKFSYGLITGVQYKDFEFNMTIAGVMGNKIYNRKRALRYAQTNYNYDYDMYKHRWHGEGTSNSYPSTKALTKGWNVSNTSDFYVESGSYFRIQNLQLAYNLRNIKMGSFVIPNIHMSVNAENPLTVFKAHSFTPEITDSNGWDTEVYPMYSTYTFGLRFDF